MYDSFLIAKYMKILAATIINRSRECLLSVIIVLRILLYQLCSLSICKSNTNLLYIKIQTQFSCLNVFLIPILYKFNIVHVWYILRFYIFIFNSTNYHNSYLLINFKLWLFVCQGLRVRIELRKSRVKVSVGQYQECSVQ